MAARKKPFKTIDEYIQAFPDDVRGLLEEMRQAIHRAAPGAVEAISYQIPAFNLDGTYLVYFAGYKNHIGIYPRPSGTKAFEKELAPYKAAKSSVRFPITEPIPYGLVKKIVKLRMKEHQQKKKRK